MAIQVNFYNNSSSNNVVHKNIGTVVSQQNCNLFSECSITNPILLVDLANSNLKNANYCYIANFGRYYYIEDITIYNGNKLRITLKCDVLMSFWGSISRSQCQAKRSSSNPNNMLVDDTKTYSAKPTYNYRVLGGFEFTPTASGSYVVTVGGK